MWGDPPGEMKPMKPTHIGNRICISLAAQVTTTEEKKVEVRLPGVYSWVTAKGLHDL